jgi:geranylgeranyl pyrophosphate synthase
MFRYFNTFSSYFAILEKFKLIDYLPRSITLENMNLTGDYDTNSLTNGLSNPIWDMIDRGGKNWRAALCIITAQLFDCPLEKVLPLAWCLEIIHAGSLICDDIEDNSEKRRGKPCTHKLFGLDRALNAGNFMYFLPLRIIMDCDMPKDIIYKLIEDYKDEMINIHLGQCTDIEWNKSDIIPSQSQYIRMVTNKTSVLCRLAVKFPIRLSAPGDGVEQALIQHAENLGVSFQIWDDIINLESEEYAKGRSYLGEDITEGKKTLIIIRALQQSGSDRLQKILALKTKDLNLVKEALDIIKQTDALDYCKKFAESLLAESWDNIQKTLPASEAKENLYYLSFKLINRKS